LAINGQLVLILAMVALLSGCRWQVGKLPFPTPTPSPTATPTPTPISISSAAASAAEAPAAASLAARVATATADYFTAATDEAADGAATVGSSLSDSDGDADALAGGVTRARTSLARTREAYRRSEAAVFFVDPDSAEELRAQPDPFGVASPTVENKAIEQLEAALTKLEDLLDGSIDASNAGTLLVEAKSVAAELESLENGLRSMADAWQTQDPGNFRRKYFLESPEGAVARIFQGLLAMTGDLLPADLLSEETNSAIDTAARVAAVREIYLGTAEDAEAAVSLHALVQQTSPVQAALTRASIARAAALAAVLELSPENESVRSQLAPALQDLTRQLTSAAESLGIVVVSSE
jgi:hypothetical protein